MENCVYVDISAWNGAAITENGDLYMWGLNIFGQCGVAKSENVHDFVWAPEKVLENVSMVWLEAIRQNDDGIDTELENFSWAVHSYTFDNFALLQDGTLLATGENLGKDSVTTVVDGDLNQAGSHRASFGFVPVRAVVYSTEYNQRDPGGIYLGNVQGRCPIVVHVCGTAIFPRRRRRRNQYRGQ